MGESELYVLNAQGDVIKLREEDGSLRCRYTYDAWGKILSVYDVYYEYDEYVFDIAYINPLRYRGYIYDDDTDLYYCQSRYYDPQIRRFINADSLVSTGSGFNGFNMFAYCNNNPVMYSDPSGHVVTSWDEAHCSDSEIVRLHKLTRLWHNSNSQSYRNTVHRYAVEIRSQYLSEGQWVGDDGYVKTDTGDVCSFVLDISSYGSGDYFRKYIIDYTMEEHAFHVNVEQDGIGWLCAFDASPLSQHMMNSYNIRYGKDFYGRSVNGIAREIAAHYEAMLAMKTLFDDYQNKNIYQRAYIADIEDTLHGSQTWRAFEPIWMQ